MTNILKTILTDATARTEQAVEANALQATSFEPWHAESY